jgi:hypothetical protein
MSRHKIIVLRNSLRTFILYNDESSVTTQKDVKAVYSTQFVTTQERT